MADSGKHGKSSKAQRNYRINGQNRGASPNTATSTKYVRSGGPARQAAKAARNHGCKLPTFHVRGSRDKKHAQEWRRAA